MSRFALPLLIIFVTGFGCQRQNVTRTTEPNLANIQTSYETEQRAAVSAIIRDMYTDDRTHLLVIQHAEPCPTPESDETSDPKVTEIRQQMEDHVFKEMPELTRATIDDFHARASECHPLSTKLDIPIQYVLVGSKDLEPLFPKGEFDRAWSRFYAKYPKSSGIIHFSNPGFNRNYTQAVVSTGRGCGGLCGAGHFVLLTKDSGVWKVINKITTWVS